MLKTSRCSVLPRVRVRRPTKPSTPSPSERPAEPSAEETPVREWLVDRVRSQLDHGSYDEDKKIDMLLDRLAADLGIPLEDDSPDERTR